MSAAPVIQAANVDKSYGPVRALRQASFEAVPGEVHALVGENGAGKSTMIKILCGVTRPERGAIRFGGQEVTLTSPHEAESLGIGTAFQELTLLPWLSVGENLLLGREPRGPTGLIRIGRIAAVAREMLADCEVTSIDPAAGVDTLSLAQQQIVEIVRAVSRKPRVLFLDEPTSALPDHEVRWLFTLVRRLRDQGTCIVFTSHRWREVVEIADRITVFRGGTNVATEPSLDEDEAVRLMTGRSTTRSEATLAQVRDGVALRVSGLTGERLAGVTFTAREGEIVGIGGLEGQGQRELFGALFGTMQASGEIGVHGTPVRLRSPKDAVRAGIALVPEDRKAEGLFLGMPIRTNLSLPVLHRIAPAGLITAGRETAAVREMIGDLGITAPSTEQVVGALSGGNQQKVLLGKWLLTDAKILLLYDVTRGVDIATKRDIFRIVAELARQGKTVLFYSSDTAEVAEMSHRVLVMRAGRIAAELTGKDVTAERIVAAAVRDETPAPAAQD
jgi:ribose transport system ATP-binding protein